MPRLIWVFAWHTLSLLVLSCCGSLSFDHISTLTILGEEGEDADLEAPKIYEPIPTLDALAEKLISYMEQYNETIRGAKMDLVFFKVIFSLTEIITLQHLKILTKNRFIFWSWYVILIHAGTDWHLPSKLGAWIQLLNWANWRLVT